VKVGPWFYSGSMEKPVIRSVTEFADYLAEHLGMVRMMRKLSRDDAYLIRLDELMSERWVSVINCNSPTPEQKRVALEERENVSNLFPRVQPATKELLVRIHSLQAYANALPAPGAASGGWEIRADLLHPDNVVKMLTAALDDAKRLNGLDGENEFFKGLLDQLLEMARWTRTSLNPSPEDRAKVHMGDVTQEKLDEELKNVLTRVCRSMHDFCELYASFPTQAPFPKMKLQPIVGPTPPPAPKEMPRMPDIPHGAPKMTELSDEERFYK
jgi:hypothetical protein